MTKNDIVRRIVPQGRATPVGEGRAFAPANIALVKYWGKRDDELNLPRTSSLSVSLGGLGATTSIACGAGPDTLVLNGKAVDPGSDLAVRLVRFLDLFRPDPDIGFHVVTDSTLPIAAGLASSAAGFAAAVKALNGLFGWNLEPRALSILARMGSGSASRSLFDGFVKWHAGEREDGMDSFAEPLARRWPRLRMGLLVLSRSPKPIGSREAMNRTRDTSSLYAAWPDKVARDMADIERALEADDFPALGRTAESNALAMHATMIDSRPPVFYWLAETITAMRRIWDLREGGLEVYFTMDAGPNLKLIFCEESAAAVAGAFPEVQVVAPFARRE